MSKLDLSTTYLGLRLEHPVVASASPLSYTLEGIERLAEAGAAAVVMYSLFEEQIEQESHTLHHYLEYGTHSYAEALDYFPKAHEFNLGPQEYLELIRTAKERVSIPIIGSLNGVSPGGWTEYARLIEQAGADALELNLYYLPTDPTLTGAEVEEMYLEVVREVRRHIQIPVAVKVGPYFSNPAHMAARFVQAGADGLVLFNRFYQPDFDLEQLEVTPNLALSRPEDLRLPLTWVAILYGRIQADLAITSGVHGHLEVLKSMMAGAKVAMMASELLKKGPGRIKETLQELRTWMLTHEYESIRQMQGSMSQLHVANPEAFERGNYMKVLRSWRPDPTGMLLG
ncbi:dihydroorotate dehydrogenase-like protein [Meiothermus cerbereus]|uniref:dihydroorotate dehydrogenase-like protein n=1 Tax=Meiothermus cerbereus TaxID=65552 RepID=UPI003EEEBBA4